MFLAHGMWCVQFFFFELSLQMDCQVTYCCHTRRAEHSQAVESAKAFATVAAQEKEDLERILEPNQKQAWDGLSQCSFSFVSLTPPVICDRSMEKVL